MRVIIYFRNNKGTWYEIVVALKIANISWWISKQFQIVITVKSLFHIVKQNIYIKSLILMKEDLQSRLTVYKNNPIWLQFNG